MPPIGVDEIAARYLAALERSDLLVGMVDGEARLVHANPAGRRQLGRELDALTTADVFTPESFSAYYDIIRPTLAAGESWRGPIEMVAADGTTFVLDVHAFGGAGPGGEIEWLTMVGSVLDEDATARHTGLDPLTGLANRASLDVQLRHALGRAGRNGGAVGVLMIDLDGFKSVNDRLGHRAGDDALRRTADALVGGVRPGDLVARYGGDEFVVVCEPVESDHDLVGVTDRLHLAVEGVGDAVGSPLGASIGRAIGVGGDDADDLLDRADRAMYDAKGAGGRRSRAARDGRRAPSTERTRAELAMMLSHGTLQVRWETVVRTDDRQAGAHRAVGRTRIGGRTVTGERLMLDAGEAGLLEPVVHRLVRDVCRATTERWRRFGTVPPVHVSVPAPALAAGSIDELLADLSARLGMPRDLVAVEVPGVALSRSADVFDAVESLRELGVPIVIDAVGAIGGDVRRFTELDPRALRLDPAVVPGQRREPGTAFAAAAAVASNLGVPLIATAVVRRSQLAPLHELGCELAEGPAAGPPMLDARLDEELSRRARPPRRRRATG